MTSSRTSSCFPDTSTPYNSIVQLDHPEDLDRGKNKSPLGFYVDLSQVAETPHTPPSTSSKKNIFSMVIDFEGPKKDKPIKLTSSYNAYKKPKPKPSQLSRCNGSLSSSVSSVNSICLASTSRQGEEHEASGTSGGTSLTVLSASLVRNLSVSTKSSTSDESSDKNIVEKSEDEPLGESLVMSLCDDGDDEEVLVDAGEEQKVQDCAKEVSDKVDEVQSNEQIPVSQLYFFYLFGHCW